MKTCNLRDKCLTGDPVQPITNFNRRKASPDGHTYTCKTCEAARARESYRLRKDKVTQRRKNETPLEREARLEYHRERYRVVREEKLKYDAEYRKTDAGKKVMAKAHKKRRKQMAKNTAKQGGKDYQKWQVIERDTEDGILICQACKEPIEDLRDLHVDHIIPILEGGPDILANVRCVHRSCNVSRPRDGRDI